MHAVPLSMYTRYLEAVREALEQQPSEWTFKSDQRYREVLEHTPVEFANLMLKWSLKQLPDLDLNVVRELAGQNDSVGKPVQEPIAGLGTFAPSNMRYLCHAIKAWQHIDSLGLPEVDVMEIGGGYGGLALWVYGLADMFETLLRSYVIFDLPDVAYLQNHVAQALGLCWVSINGMSSARWDIGHPTDFIVSAYAFSEFDQATRDWYADRLLKHCRHGLMVWNFPEGPIKGEDGRMFGGPPYQFVEWPITRVPDEPATYEGHELVTW